MRTNNANHYKRICVFSDGSWDTPEIRNQSNVVRLTRAVLPEDEEGVQQVVLYDEGVGTGGRLDYYTGGYMGDGLDVNIKQLYTFLSLNYDDGDEVYMFGFSRGAYTVRSLAGMIHCCGLVRRAALDFVQEAFDLYLSNPGPDSEKAVAFRTDHNSNQIDIKAVVCFDTVPALGLPKRIFGFSLPDQLYNKYKYHDTDIHDEVEHAIHTVSIDEDKAAYAPTMMKRSEGKKTKTATVTQKFFWGTHVGIGGVKYRQRNSGETALRFVVNELRRQGCKLAFDTSMIPEYPDIDPESEIEDRTTNANIMRTVAGTQYRNVIAAEDVHWTAVRRFQEVETYRPVALKPFERELAQADWRQMRDSENGDGA